MSMLGDSQVTHSLDFPKKHIYSRVGLHNASNYSLSLGLQIRVNLIYTSDDVM
jgi:hypothetical protein